MAEPAYELQRFAPRAEKPEPKPRVRVAKQRANTAKPVFRMIRTLLAVAFIVVLVCGVLYTQTTVTELQSQISDKNQELVEEEALYAYLSFELESMTTQRNIEQRAEELGLVPINSNQITYVQVEDGEQIEVRDNDFSLFRQRLETGLNAIADHVSP